MEESRSDQVARNTILILVMIIAIGGIGALVFGQNSTKKQPSTILGEESTNASANPVLSTQLSAEQNQTSQKNKTTPEPDKEMKTEEQITQLKAADLVVGEGPEATSGARVTVNYVGTLTNGQKFDSSYDRNAPFTFNLGAGEVIQGWDMGVLGMKVGGKRKLLIPANLAYGERGVGNIPPNSPLIFEVELLKVE